MKLAKKIFAIFLVIAIVTTTIVVQAQELSNQLSLNTKIKTFINANSVEIMSSYFENGVQIYKVHDVLNDKYYKLALNKKNEIDWYDNVLYKRESKMDYALIEKLKNVDKNEKIPVIVELSYDYTSIYKELSKIKSDYFDNNGVKQSLNSNENEEAKKIRLQYLKEKMVLNNVLTIDKDYEKLGVSEYAPFVFYNITKEQINKLVENEKVYSIGLFPTNFVEETITQRAITAVNNNSIYATRVNLVKDSGINGSGVKIGQMESGSPNISNPYLAGKSITIKSDCAILNSEHATEVAGIMIGSNGVAPAASIYSACLYASSSSLVTNFVNGINWLVSNNVDIINMSAQVPYSDAFGYNTVDRWIDAITYMNDILFVQSSGNSYNANTVVTPGLAHNALTVGSIDYTGTDYSAAMSSTTYRSEFSSYTTFGTGGVTNKPELVAPGEGINYTNSYSSEVAGTSFSAPLVSGAAALLMQSTPSTKNNFRAIKAALFVTARPMNNYPRVTIAGEGGFPITYYHYNDEVGNGILDGKAAYDLLRWGQFVNFSVDGGSSSSYTYYNTLSNGKNIRVAANWSKPNTATSLNSIINYNTDSVADLDLQILGPNGEKVSWSGAAHDNVEWLNFVTSSGYGAYQFKVINYATNGNAVPTQVSMAWW